MLNSNYLIINRKPQKFHEIKMAGKTAIFLDAEGRTLDRGTIKLDDSVYAALFCDDACNVTLVTDRDGRQDVQTILWCSEAGYSSGRQTIAECLTVKLSRQNLKLNRYAEEIAAKLSNGVRVMVVDAPLESDMVRCPECGMMSPGGTPYCMDCGTEL